MSGLTSVTVTSPLDRFWSMSGGTNTVTQPTWWPEIKTKEKLFADLFLHHRGVDLAHVAVLVTNTDIPGQKLVNF